MEQRIKEIRSRFSMLKNEQSLNTNSNSKIVLKEKCEEKTVDIASLPKGKLVDVEKPLVKKPAKDQTPLMIKKINRHRQELAKNNLKKQQQAFVFHGTIDDYEKELEKRMGKSEKEIE